MYADDEIASRLRALGVTDSKRLSDGRVRALAPRIRAAAGAGRYRVMRLEPRRYNEIYAMVRAEGRNLNWLLAWEHVRCIEDLLAGGLRAGYAIVDRFAHPRHVQDRLMPLARASGLQVFQLTRAERDVAVAAASILAREAFIDWLAAASVRAGFRLPRGASARVEQAARRIGAAGGRRALRDVAKLHFRTTDRALAPSAVRWPPAQHASRHGRA